MRISSLSLPLAVLGLVGSAAAYPYSEAETISRRGTEDQAKADAVKEAFQHAWNGYIKYAFPNDELRPVSNGFSNSRLVFPANIVLDVI
jgi:mannosyl-oligosaccharide alpha-1,2-mannosidase